MTAFDDDQEYEAQLKDVLNDQVSSMEEGHKERGGQGRIAKEVEEPTDDGVLEDAPSFRMKRRPDGDRLVVKDADEISMEDIREERLLSEDARSISTGDDSPSVQGSEITLSAPTTPSKLNGYGHLSPARVFSASTGFDIRQHHRLSSYSSLPTRSPTPSMYSRVSSISSNVADVMDVTPSDSPNVPWEVVRWTKLRKIERNVFSEIGKQKFGTPTVMASSGVIAIGTSKGFVLIFDFRQSLKHVIGIGTKAAQCGPVTALSLSADHAVLLCGHSSGDIFTWDLSKPAQPHSHTPAVTPGQISTSRRDGHLAGAAIIHVDFLGLRHGAFITADEIGMAFVHTLSRKLVVANISTTRILGRYPEKLGSPQRPIKPHKPSCVLGMCGLPLGSVKYVTDEMQLVALLSPYKLVVCSIIPFPQTQLRIARPKRASSEGSILSGCIAWYPSVKPDPPNNENGSASQPKLVYAWDRYLAIRQVSEILPDKDEGKEGPPRLQFALVNEWVGEETIVTAQWLLQQVLVLLTISQRLLILDTSTMQVTASCDLLMKQILHHDRFSQHMINFPAVADAYYSSFKTYKHKIFLLCAEEVSVGSLLTWADRILALVEAGDFIQAINLTSSYYNGKCEKITLGLPENDDERHAVVQDKLTEMIIASLKYVFSHKYETSGNDYVHAEIAQQKLVRDLTAACIDACLSMQSPAFLFDEVYEIFEEFEQTDVFIEVLEPYILKDGIQVVPPAVVKDITTHFVKQKLHQRLEQVICHINPTSLDIDQITSICRTHALYDALAYVYNNALKDYITPMVEFVGLITKFFTRHRQILNSNEVVDLPNSDRASLAFDAFKVFPYLSYTLTGRVYPTGEDLPEQDAYEAKQSLYYFLFSGRTLSWPRRNGQLIRTVDGEEPTFPYVRLLLAFDAPTLFQALDEAFEDRFLNGAGDSSPTTNGLESFGRTITRQFIINIFLEVIPSSSSEIVYLYMFISRNLPKYPQFILLSGSAIENILLRLCTYGSTEMAEEAQLAAEYLLSVFKPADSEKMIRAYSEAKFYRILKATLRAEGRYTELLDVFLEDQEKVKVFECVEGLLYSWSVLTSKQREGVKGFLLERLEELVRIDAARTAMVFERHITERQKEAVQRLRGDPAALFVYLDTLFSRSSGAAPSSWVDIEVRELYISLMCKFRPMDLTGYLEGLGVHDFQVERILPVLEESNVIDAIVLVLRRSGMTKDAINKVVIHISGLKRLLSEIIEQGGAESEAEAVVSEVSKYASVGADLCESFSRETIVKPTPLKKGKGVASKFNEAEEMWLGLLETVVGVTREIAVTINETRQAGKGARTHERTLDLSRVVVQDIFTKLLTLTSSTQTTSSRRTPTIQVSFLAILRRFLENLASTPLTDLRSVLSSIFDAYRYERQLIEVMAKLVEADLFKDLLRSKQARERGWRPSSTNCIACGRILFGPGAKGSIFTKWERGRLAAAEKKLAQDEARRKDRVAASQPGTPDSKGKGKSVDMLPSPVDIAHDEGMDDVEGDILVFGCGHAYHRECLSELVGSEGDEGNMEARFRCIVCEAH